MPRPGDYLLADHLFLMQSYTPVITGGGTATFSALTGRFIEIGQLVWMNAYAVVNAAGSGASNVTITAPTSIDRSMRQIVPCQAEGAFGLASNFHGELIAFTGGSGATWDRIRMIDGVSTNREANVTGADLRASGIWTFSGWYLQP